MDTPTEPKRLLNPIDRAGEILFGLIMALTFTCSISIATTSNTEIKQLLIAAISSNLAWGIIDATMYLIGLSIKRNRNKVIFDYVQGSTQSEKAKKYIIDVLPPVITRVLDPEDIEKIRTKIKNLPDQSDKVQLTLRDYKKAAMLFFLVFASTFPVVIPFLLIKDPNFALRISNLVALIMMFMCGWSVASYSGINKWKVSLGLVFVGISLVALSIALGG